jgi:branched-chain amino acid transport system substrate-binding protein
MTRRVLIAMMAVVALVGGMLAGALAQSGQEIRVGHPVPLTGPIAQSGTEMVRGMEMFLDETGSKIAGRPVRVINVDTGCNPDNAITQTRKLVQLEKVHFIVGPLCGHEGQAVAQVSRETGVPVLMSMAAADEVTKWKRTPTVVRTGFSASQPAHAFGDYIARDVGCRKATSIANDYTYGHEAMLGALATFKAAGGEVLKSFWTPIGTTDYAPILAGIPADTQCVLVTVVGVDSNRLFEQWFDFGYDRKFKIYGNYWLREEVLRQVDDRAVGLISMALQWASGVETPETKKFVDAYARKYKQAPAFFAEHNYATMMWAKAAIESIGGRVEDRDAFLQAVRKVSVVAPRGRLKLDEYDNPVQNEYIFKVAKVNHPLLGEVKMNVPVKTYEAVSQFWTWTPQEFMARGPYKR